MTFLFPLCAFEACFAPISRDWKKYGYELDTSIGQDEINSLNYSSKLMLWKNEHMNAKTAMLLVQDIKKNQKDFKIMNWQLIRLGLPNDLDSRLAVFDTGIYPTHIPFINNYIQKKLGQ